MNFAENEITLKNGKTAILRAPKSEDAEEMINMLKACCAQTDYLASLPEEICFTTEQEKEFLAVRAKGEEALMVVCTVEGELAGNCSVEYNKAIKTAHRATVGITVLEKYWHLGIGTAMMSRIISEAKAHRVEQLELEYIEGNERARKLYDKLGFRVTGELPNGVRLTDGTSLKLITMIKNIGE